jgi:hypothetical protein
MSDIKLTIEMLDDFKGEDVILVSFNKEGLNDIEDALLRLKNIHSVFFGESSSKTKYEFITDDSRDELVLSSECIQWLITKQKRDEILDKITAMKIASFPCHHYIDIQHPTNTLVLSLDEYKTQSML